MIKSAKGIKIGDVVEFMGDRYYVESFPRRSKITGRITVYEIGGPFSFGALVSQVKKVKPTEEEVRKNPYGDKDNMETRKKTKNS